MLNIVKMAGSRIKQESKVGHVLCGTFLGETQWERLFTTEREPTMGQSKDYTEVQHGKLMNILGLFTASWKTQRQLQHPKVHSASVTTQRSFNR